MTKQTIFLGNTGNDGRGEKLRVAFDKVNNNFTEVYTSISTIQSDISTISAPVAYINYVYDFANTIHEEVTTLQDEISLSLGLGYGAYQTSNLAYSKANNFLVTLAETSKGQSGDKQGMFAANDTYLYYCTEDYSTGNVDIWRRVSWSNDVW